MSLTPSKITKEQWQKVLKALYYSVGSGFSAGILLSLAGLLQTNANVDLKTLAIGGIVGGVVGALNALAVTVKQLFTPAV